MLVGKFSRALDGKPKRKKNITGKMNYQPARDTVRRMCGYSPEVMVRITSYGKGPGNALANLGYISRTDAHAERENKADLELETDRGEILSGAEAIREYARGWEQDFGKPNKRRRDTLRMILSMPEGTNPEAVKGATREFARRTFAGRREYVFVLHTDEPHPHCHLTVKMLGRDGTRLDVDREDLANWREEFAQTLREQQVAAVATRRAARGVVRKAEKSVVQHIADHPRDGKVRVPKVVAMREREAAMELIAEQQGRPLPARPWEPHIRAEQQAVRSAWLDAADHLERSTLAPVLFPSDHAVRLRSAQAHAAGYQARLSERPAVDPRKAPSRTSIKTTAALPRLVEVKAIGAVSNRAGAARPVVLRPENHYERTKDTQQQGAAYQVRLAVRPEGEPPRRVTDLAALPRLKSGPYGVFLRWQKRRPLEVSSLASMPTLASLNALAAAAGPGPNSPRLVFTQEIRYERPSSSQYFAGVYQSHLATPRGRHSRTVPSLRELPRVDVVRRGAFRRSSAQMLLQQDARYFLGLIAGADPAMRREGSGLAGDRGSPGREGRTQGRGSVEAGRAGGGQEATRSGQAGTQGRGGAAEGGPRGRQETTRGGQENTQSRQESAGQGGRWSSTYRDTGTVARILRLSDATGSATSDKALANDIRAFVAAMPAVETMRDVLKRQLAARFPAKAPEQATEQQRASEQEKGADQAAPKGREHGL